MIPEVPVDRSGHPRLPSRLGLKLKTQQLLVREIFKKAYGKVTQVNMCFLRINSNCLVKYTGSTRALVPWLLLTKGPEEYIDNACYPTGFLIRDPSKLTKSNVDKLWCHWEEREKNNEVVLRFIGAKPEDMLPPADKKPKRQARKLAYVEIDRESNDDDEDYSGDDSATNDEDDKDNDDDDDSGTDRSRLRAAGSSRRTQRKSGSSSARTHHSKRLLAAESSPAKGKTSSSSGGNVRPQPRPVKKTTVEPSSPAAHKDDRLAFLNGLSTDPRYVALLGKLRLLPPFV